MREKRFTTDFSFHILRIKICGGTSVTAVCTNNKAALTVSATIANTMTIELEHVIHVLTTLKNLGLKSLTQFNLLCQCLSPIATSILSGQIETLDDLKKMLKKVVQEKIQTHQPLERRISPMPGISDAIWLPPTKGTRYLRDAKELFGERIADYDGLPDGNDLFTLTIRAQAIPYMVNVESGIGELTSDYSNVFLANEEQVLVFCENHPHLLGVQYTGDLTIFPYRRCGKVCFAIVNKSRSGLELELVRPDHSSDWRVRRGDQLVLLAHTY